MHDDLREDGVRVAPGADRGPLLRPRLDVREIAGAVGDVGVLVPIAVAMIVVNGLSATAALLPAGVLYILSGLYYRVPVPVQPLKAFGAIAIAARLGPDEIAAGALLMGVVFLVLGATGLLDRAARVFPLPLVRAVQLSVGLLFLEVATGLVTAPPTTFADHTRPTAYLVGGALLVAVLAALLRRYAVSLALVAVGVVVVLVTGPGAVALGPAPLDAPDLSWSVVAVAAVTLTLPQIPLTFANSCIGAAEAARTYYGAAARRVTPNRLAISLGLANVGVGAVSGMPVCHGAGGFTAHRAFGARTGGASIAIGTLLVGLALGVGAGLGPALQAFPLPVLAGLLAVAGVLHMTLLRDLRRPVDWAFAVVVGVLGVVLNLAVALVLGLLAWWLVARLDARRRGTP
ncbi:putative sulfate/molybdate transporter [Actinotalea sp. Marseille-Q4924]|uniref:putative sulfate/molybdate transporter n=1 Tax=Actinotalea sp. Marseille-Q4924 TaxID=2866571 RepID=UPI001CE44C4C|nr:putative sulfate/molybdate transporter [Actinotalea sp. Marseille-Q4924]